MSVRFRLLTEADVKSVLMVDSLIETMASVLQQFSAGRAVQPYRRATERGIGTELVL